MNKNKKQIDIPWFEKYRPKSTKEMVGFTNIITQIKNFLRNFESKLKNGTLKVKERAILLEGPPGIGKTTVVYAIANDLGYSVIELNASDARTEEIINKKLKEAVGNTNIMAFMDSSISNKKMKKIIFIDEVDGISGQSDRGGLSALLKIIRTTKNPIIMAANFYDTKFKTLYDNVTKIKCNPLKKPSILRILKKIAENENLNIDDESLNIIAENSSGDLRSAINDLQALTQGSLKLDDLNIGEINMERDTQIKMYNFIEDMFKQETLRGARNIASNTDFDYTLLHKIIYSNMKSYIPDINDFTEALKNLAEADKIISIIKKYKDFSLLPYYFDLVSGGVVFSVNSPNLLGYKKFNFPKLKSIRMSLIESPIIELLQQHIKKSKIQIALETIPFLKELINLVPRENKEDFIMKLANEFNIDAKTLKNLF
ncbi:MAG: replication factor C large subunit [Promethearchaeota archaeon]